MLYTVQLDTESGVLHDTVVVKPTFYTSLCFTLCLE